MSSKIGSIRKRLSTRKNKDSDDQSVSSSVGAADADASPKRLRSHSHKPQSPVARTGRPTVRRTNSADDEKRPNMFQRLRSRSRSRSRTREGVDKRKDMLVAVTSCRSDGYYNQKAPGSTSKLPRKAPTNLKLFHELAVGVKDAYAAVGAVPKKPEKSDKLSDAEFDAQMILWDFVGNLDFVSVTAEAYFVADSFSFFSCLLWWMKSLWILLPVVHSRMTLLSRVFEMSSKRATAFWKKCWCGENASTLFSFAWRNLAIPIKSFELVRGMPRSKRL